MKLKVIHLLCSNGKLLYLLSSLTQWWYDASPSSHHRCLFSYASKVKLIKLIIIFKVSHDIRNFVTKKWSSRGVCCLKWSWRRRCIECLILWERALWNHSIIQSQIPLYSFTTGKINFFPAHDLNLNLKGPQTWHHFNSLELLNWQLNNLIGWLFVIGSLTDWYV